MVRGAYFIAVLLRTQRTYISVVQARIFRHSIYTESFLPLGACEFVCSLQPALKALAYTPHIPVSRDKSSVSRGLVTPACACQFTASEVPLCKQNIPPGKCFFLLQTDTLLCNSLPALSKRAAVSLTDVSNNEGLVLCPIYCR